jgi:ribosomal protein L11 methyltransferase
LPDSEALSLWLKQDALILGFPAPVSHWQLMDEEELGQQLETTLAN